MAWTPLAVVCINKDYNQEASKENLLLLLGNIGSDSFEVERCGKFFFPCLLFLQLLFIIQLV